MSMSWRQIKTLAGHLQPDAVGTVVDTEDATLSQLAYYARMAHMRIAGCPHKFRCLIREYTLTLTGATEYALGTLIPDLQKVYQVHDGSSEVGLRSLAEFNIYGGISLAFIGNAMRLKEPMTGTLIIPYFSNYLVADDDGVRKLDFTEDDDVTILPHELEPVLIEGIMDYVYRNATRKEYTKRVQMPSGQITDMNAFEYELQKAILNDSPADRAFTDFRYLP
jgi:hypothetical protein